MCNGYKCTVILLVQYLSDFYLFMMYISPPLPSLPPSLYILDVRHFKGRPATPEAQHRPPAQGTAPSVRDFGSLIKTRWKKPPGAWGWPGGPPVPGMGRGCRPPRRSSLMPI